MFERQIQHLRDVATRLGGTTSTLKKDEGEPILHEGLQISSMQVGASVVEGPKDLVNLADLERVEAVIE